MRRRDFLSVVTGGVALAVLPKGRTAMPEDDVDVSVVPPPGSAVVLFGGKSLSGWLSRKGGDARWQVKNGYMEVVPGTGDIYTEPEFTDFQLHLEFWLPYLPQSKGQARANSGVYLQGRYEIQVLDSYGLDLGSDDCGAIYKYAVPLRNACKRPERWQSYDVAFRAPRYSQAGQLMEAGCVTVLHNGIMIHNNLKLTGSSGGALDPDEQKPGPILLQDHGDLVRYRNIWIIEAVASGPGLVAGAVFLPFGSVSF